MVKFGVILFDTNSSVMKAEAVLLRGKQPIKLIPTPRELSSDCGISIRFDWDQKSQVELLLEQARVDFSGLHPLPEKVE
jgi:Protein of unknown function (DUF3343)